MKHDLFSSGPEWWYNAVISQPGPYQLTKWQLYADGYRMAAEDLCNLVLETEKSIDFYVYPIIYLYRHYIELRLKEILDHSSQLLDEDFDLPKTHDIKVCWTKVRKTIISIWPEEEEDTLNEMETLIDAINNIDKKSDAFRYPIDRNLNHHLQDVLFINLKNFQELIKPLCDNLDGIIQSIRVAEQHKSEMLTAYEVYRNQINEEIESYSEPIYQNYRWDYT